MKTKEEIEILIADATSGDSNAQNSLGCAYGAGDGVAKDYSKALEWFRKSAAQNNMYACFNVGLYYELGRGVKKNVYEAIKWYKLASNQGFVKAALALGKLYESGIKPSILESSQGIKYLQANPEEAFYWFNMATTEEEGRFHLARCYELGIGTTKNLRRAIELYQYSKWPQAKDRLSKILEEFNPEETTRLKSLSILSKNPYRVLGLFANASAREIKANLAKIEAYRKVGKEIQFPSDYCLPDSIAYRNLYYSDSLKTLNAKLNQIDAQISAGDHFKTRKRNRVSNLIRQQEKQYQNFVKVSAGNPDWNESVTRDDESVNRAVSELENGKRKILAALFWFHCVTEEDRKAFLLIQEGKWEAAKSLWAESESYSARINEAVLEWYGRDDNFAIQDLLSVMRDDGLRREFLRELGINSESYSVTDIKKILWDGLFSEFPSDERMFDWNELGYKLEYTQFTHDGFNDEDNDYIINKSYQEISQPLNDLLSKAKSWDGEDFDIGRQTHDRLFQEGRKIIKRIERLLGASDSRYIKICDETALELLEFAITYNNNCKDWGAPGTALYMAQWAKDITVSELLKNRCQKNVEIFEENKRISTTDKILETIDEKFCVQEKRVPTFQVVEVMIKDADLHLACLKTEIGNSAPLFIKVSSALTNRILNILIKAYNSQSGISTTSNAVSLMKKFQNFVMDQETRARYNKNKEIIETNQHSFHNRSYTAPYSNRSSYKNVLEQIEEMKKSLQKPEDSFTTKKVRKAKWVLTISYLFGIIGLIIYLSYNGGWFMEHQPWWPLTIGLDIFVLLGCVLASWEAESVDENGKFRKSFNWGCENEIRDRRKHKIWASLASLAGIGLLYWYLSWGNNYEYFWETQTWWICVCVGLLWLLNLFIIAMWFLEVQRDPEHMKVFSFDPDEVDYSTGVRNMGCLLTIPFLPYYFIMIPFKLATLIR